MKVKNGKTHNAKSVKKNAQDAVGHDSHAVARAMHDLGLAAWFGGSLMGAIGLNKAAEKVGDGNGKEILVANEGWARWTPVNLAAIGAHLVGGAILMRDNMGRVKAQKGAFATTAAKTALMGAAMAATAYSRAIGQKVINAGAVPADGPANPNAETPEDVRSAQQQLKALQWAVPALTGAMVALSSKMGEQQKPAQVARGMLARIGGR